MAPLGCAIDNAMSTLSSLLQTGEYSDLSIVCGDRTYKVHKALLCPRSHFFRGACNGNWAESTSGIIDLSEEDPYAVDCMIHYFYHDDYHVPDMDDDGDDDEPQPPARPLLASAHHPVKKLDFTGIEDPLVAAATAVCQSAARRTSPATPAAGHSTVNKATTPIHPTPCNSDAAQRHDSAYGSDAESDEPSLPCAASPPALLLHARVYALAERFHIAPLRALAKAHFELACAAQPPPPPPLLLAVAAEVYGSTPDADRGLRDAVLHVLRATPLAAARTESLGLALQAPALARELAAVRAGRPPV